MVTAKVTKEQILLYLQNMRRRQRIGSAKYLAIGAFRIYVKKGFIEPQDVVDEFPELDDLPPI